MNSEWDLKNTIAILSFFLLFFFRTGMYHSMFDCVTFQLLSDFSLGPFLFHCFLYNSEFRIFFSFSILLISGWLTWWLKTCFSLFFSQKLSKYKMVDVNYLIILQFTLLLLNKQTTTPDNYSSLASSDMFGIIMLL